jgi:glycosyltransferase involved in cell wall biosynthesis
LSERLEFRQPKIEVVVPVHNEEGSLRAFVSAVAASLEPLDLDYTILFVDDGSQDGTVAAIKRLAGEGRPVTLLKLSRNFGKEAALTAGLDASEGDAVVVMDVDLQDPPTSFRSSCGCGARDTTSFTARAAPARVMDT